MDGRSDEPESRGCPVSFGGRTTPVRLRLRRRPTNWSSGIHAQTGRWRDFVCRAAVVADEMNIGSVVVVHLSGPVIRSRSRHVPRARRARQRSSRPSRRDSRRRLAVNSKRMMPRCGAAKRLPHQPKARSRSVPPTSASCRSDDCRRDAVAAVSQIRGSIGSPAHPGRALVKREDTGIARKARVQAIPINPRRMRS